MDDHNNEIVLKLCSLFILFNILLFKDKETKLTIKKTKKIQSNIIIYSNNKKIQLSLNS